jgi:long-chain acyl-CoA synthetase
MAYPPLTQCFLEAIDRYPSPRTLVHKIDGKWEPISSAEFLRRVAGLARALSELGVGTSDRIGLIAPNRPEWHIADFAVVGVGAVNVPIYFRESAERLVYILKDSGARVVIAAGTDQVRLVASCRDRLPGVQHVIVAGVPDPGVEFLRLETLVAGAGDFEISEYRRRARDVGADQLASLIYTSGTTGEPKGVMLTHSNLTSNATDALLSYHFLPNELALSFLPLSHVYERMMDYGYIFRGIPLAYVERMEDVPQALLEVDPTLASAVPRFFEKLYANIMERGRQATGFKRQAFDWAMAVAQEAAPWRAYGLPVPMHVKLAWTIADVLVYSKIRAGLGGRIRNFVSGGAPLAKDLAEFFWSVGLPVYQGYGLTETSPVVSANVPGANRVGTVGRPIANVEVRIADDGEILVRGPCVMQGYFHKPQETREALTPDGWLRTGDIGYLDVDGYLVVTDRKKELLKTAAGKFIAPQPIENRLKASPYISNAAVVGDKRKFVSVLLVPNFSAVEAKAREAEIEFRSPEEIAASPWVRDLIAAEVERLTKDLAQYEKPKRFALLSQDFTMAGGEVPYTLKLKRRVIEQRYRDVIENLYADVEEPRPQHHT